MPKSTRGFASMDPDRRRIIAGKGGKTAQALGKSHKWTSEEARKAGRIGGKASPKRKYKKGAVEKLGR
jgi:general stress protein YciG